MSNIIVENTYFDACHTPKLGGLVGIEVTQFQGNLEIDRFRCSYYCYRMNQIRLDFVHKNPLLTNLTTYMQFSFPLRVDRQSLSINFQPPIRSNKYKL
jgi:hypothetical protein